MSRPRSFLSILRVERAPFAALAAALVLLHAVLISSGMAQAATAGSDFGGMILCMPEQAGDADDTAAVPDHCVCIPGAPQAMPPAPASAFARRRTPLRLTPRRTRPPEPAHVERRLRPPGRAPPASS